MMTLNEIKENIKTWKNEWKVDSVIFLKRIDECHKCMQYATISGLDKCNVCGCILLIKANYTKSKCPLGKW